MLASFLLFACFVNIVQSTEPRCSKFHYEEKTLEKVIKFEFLVTQMKTEMDTLHRQVVEMLETMATVKEQLNVEWKTHSNIINKAFDEMKEKNDGIMSQYAEQFKQMNEDTNIPTIAFLGKDVTNNSPTNDHIFVFKTTEFNEGNGYDNSTGIFTAPVGGTYLFTVQFCINKGSALHYEFVADDKAIKRGWFYDANIPSCYSTDAMVVLEAGADVWVKLINSATSIYTNAYWWSSFSGAIMHK